MKSTLKYIFANSLFFRLFIVFVFSWTYLMFSYGDVGLFELINEQHHPVFDQFFKYLTHVGGGWFALGIGLLLFAFKFRWGIIAAASFMGSAIVTQVLKRWVFDLPRPRVVFADSVQSMNLIEGVDLHMKYSFPSGHSTAVFAVFCLLSLLTLEKKYLGFLFCFIAILVGYSRAYLFQHFPEDILVGSLIGTLSSLIIYSWLKNKKFGDWGDKSIFKKTA